MTNRPWKYAALVLTLAIIPAVARAQAMHSVCKDATKSVAAGKGTCSGHGGVDDAATRKMMASGKGVMGTEAVKKTGKAAA